MFRSDTQASNVVVKVGTLLAERLLYVPSVGYCLAASYAFVRLSQWAASKPRGRGGRVVLWAAAGAFLCALATQTRLRTEDWRTDEASCLSTNWAAETLPK